MYVQVRSIDGKQNAIITISKFSGVKEFKKLIQEELNVIVGQQRLFFRGKQLEDEHNVCDYNVNVNDVILLMIRPNAVNDSVNNNDTCNKSKAITDGTVNIEENIACESKYFKIGDIVDARDICYGAWFEGKIVGIYKIPDSLADNDSEIEDGLLYKVLFDRYPFNNPVSLSLKEIRPRARNKISALSVKEGQNVMVNYNIERPTQRGFWYDLLVTSVSKTNIGKAPTIKGNLFVGHDNNVLNDCKIKFIDDIMKIERKTFVAERSEQELLLMQTETENPRVSSPFCDKCHDKTKKCIYCNCHICGLKTDPEKQVLCDECNMAFHIWCLTPPLDKVPEVDEWYCMECKNDENEIIKAGEKLKQTKSRTSTNSRNRGRGMACVGRSKDCTLVPLDHFGAIPGIEVGTTWKFRMQVAEAGIHRPHVAGIHGRETDGAYSIVLSGGYEDDVDNGDEIIYTGSGGRDLTGRRTATQQSCDQTLTRLNKALALNCNAPFNPIDGAEAQDWCQGKPVRVVRNFRGARHSKYAPKEGNRYDGLYKVVKYYPEKGKSGYIVWRYLLKRDDAVPAPWTKEGKLRIASLGLEILYPDGYLTAMRKNDKENSPISKGKRKNRLQAHFVIKRPKIIPYELEEDVKKEIDNDQKNAKVWESMKSNLSSGKKVFLSKIEEQFTCICCHELIFQPVTMKCYHNICLVCLQRSFAAKLYECPYCRTELGKNYKIIENKSLQKILLNLFPGYSSGR